MSECREAGGLWDRYRPLPSTDEDGIFRLTEAGMTDTRGTLGVTEPCITDVGFPGVTAPRGTGTVITPRLSGIVMDLRLTGVDDRD